MITAQQEKNGVGLLAPKNPPQISFLVINPHI